jgi:hypothetical protein
LREYVMMFVTAGVGCIWPTQTSSLVSILGRFFKGAALLSFSSSSD